VLLSVVFVVINLFFFFVSSGSCFGAILIFLIFVLIIMKLLDSEISEKLVLASTIIVARANFNLK
jgi:hypothetical protein